MVAGSTTDHTDVGLAGLISLSYDALRGYLALWRCRLRRAGLLARVDWLLAVSLSSRVARHRFEPGNRARKGIRSWIVRGSTASCAGSRRRERAARWWPGWGRSPASLLSSPSVLLRPARPVKATAAPVAGRTAASTVVPTAPCTATAARAGRRSAAREAATAPARGSRPAR